MTTTPPSSTAPSVSTLFGSAVDTGALSQSTVSNLGLIDLGSGIQDAFGITVDDVQATEVILVGVLTDDSGSIRFANNAQHVRDGHNLLIDALKGAGDKTKDGILMLSQYLNGEILFPFVAIDQAKRMTASNYNPNGGTPLYDQTAVFLATMMAKCQEFLDNGVPCRTISLIMTDGADVSSHRQTAGTVKQLVGDMLRAENHIIAGMGIEDPNGGVDFRDIFLSMGIVPEWILTPGSTAKEIRDAFHTFSQSAVRASQGAASFSQAAGGFGNN